MFLIFYTGGLLAFIKQKYHKMQVVVLKMVARLGSFWVKEIMKIG